MKPGARVVDLGCAPGGWCQVAVARVNALGQNPKKPIGTVLGVDLQEVEPIAGAEIHQLDFLDDEADAKVKGWLGGRADVVMSDMAAASSGHKGTDHLRIVALVEAALAFAFDVLEDGGTFVAKVLAGGAEIEMQTLLKRNFTKVANVKPPASRSDSSEKFVVAMGFRGRDLVDAGSRAGRGDRLAGSAHCLTISPGQTQKGRPKGALLPKIRRNRAAQPPQLRTGPQSMWTKFDRE